MTVAESIFAVVGGLVAVACGIFAVRKSRLPSCRDLFWTTWPFKDEPGDLETIQGFTFIVGVGFSLFGTALALFGTANLIFGR